MSLCEAKEILATFSLTTVLSLLINIFLTFAEAMDDKCKKREFIRKVLKFNLPPNLYFKPPTWSEEKHFPDVFLFDPMSLNYRLQCPVDSHALLLQTSDWTDFGSKDARLIYGSQKNVWLVSKLYNCPKCKSKIRAHSDGILTQIKEIPTDFILTFQAGFTQELHNLIITSIAEGI